MTIRRNTVYNISGSLFPLLISIVSVPLFIHQIGAGRYGVLALAWLLFGYFGLFDLGLSTATTNAIARARNEPEERRRTLLATALVTNGVLGGVIAIVVVLISPMLRKLPLNLSPDLSAELFDVIPWLAAAVPLVTLGGVFGGVLSAHERFLQINVIGLAGTALFQLVPLMVAYTAGPSLVYVVPAAIIARAAPVVLSGVAALRLLPLRDTRFEFATLRSLLAYGGWVMMTNLIATVLISLDQFMVGLKLGAVAVTHYAVAYSFAVRLQILPAGVVQTLFPLFSQRESSDALTLAGEAWRTTLVAMTLLCVPAILISRPFFELWLGTEFGKISAPIAEILLVSIWVNGLAFIPFGLLQAQGRVRFLALLHVFDIAPFVTMLIVGINYLGLVGAALAWLMRVSMDTGPCIIMSRLPRSHLRLLPSAGLVVFGTLIFAQLDLLSNLGLTIAALASGLALFVWATQVDTFIRNIVSNLTGVSLRAFFVSS